MRKVICVKVDATSLEKKKQQNHKFLFDLLTEQHVNNFKNRENSEKNAIISLCTFKS